MRFLHWDLLMINLTIMMQGNPSDTLLTPWEQPLHNFVLFSSWNPLDGLCPYVDNFEQLKTGWLMFPISVAIYLQNNIYICCFLYLNKFYLIGVLLFFLHKPIWKSWVSSRNGFFKQSKLFSTFSKRKEDEKTFWILNFRKFWLGILFLLSIWIQRWYAK